MARSSVASRMIAPAVGAHKPYDFLTGHEKFLLSEGACARHS